MRRDPAERHTRQNTHRAMLAERSNITDVKLPQTITKLVEHENRRNHRRIDLPRMSHVQAERCVGERGEQQMQLGYGSPSRFSIVHVFNTEP